MTNTCYDMTAMLQKIPLHSTLYGPYLYFNIMQMHSKISKIKKTKYFLKQYEINYFYSYIYLWHIINNLIIILINKKLKKYVYGNKITQFKFLIDVGHI